MSLLAQKFTTPGHPIAFSGEARTRKYLKGVVSRRYITNQLERLPVFTLHRKKPKPKIYNPFFIESKLCQKGK